MSALYIVPGAPASPDPNRPMGRTPEAEAHPQPPIDLDDPDDEPEASCEITFFDNYAATVKREEHHTLEALAERISTTTADTKERLPWLKLARFGDARSNQGSLRNNDNVQSLTGIEADYDAEQLSFDNAVRKLTESCIEAIVYTSPSHTEDAPRWRVLCPTSREYPPDQRDRFMARLNGLFGGIFSNESWTLSQSYYYGSIKQNPSHRVVVTEGLCIDLAGHLDATAIGKPVKPGANGDGRQGGPATRPEDISDARIRGLITALLGNVSTAADGAKHTTLFDIGRTIGGYLHVIGWSEHEAVEQLCAALPSSVADWDAARKTAAQAVALGATQPLELEDRPPNPRQRRDTDPDGGGGDPSPPPPDDGPPPGWEKARPPAEGDVAVPSDPLLTEQTAMEAFITDFHTDLRFNHSSNSWLVWSGHHWKPDGRKLAFSWALKLCKQLARGVAAKGRLVVEKVRFSAAVEQGARAMPPFATAQDDWDNDPWLLGTPGGIVDLKTGELRSGGRSDMITKITAITPAETPDCPTWDTFLDFAMNGDDQRIRFIQRFCGYCLTGLTIEEILLFLFGIAGSGKSTLVETLCGIMSDYASTAPMEVFTGVSWSPTEYYRADMAGKRLIVAAEPERDAYWAEAFVKSITGGDRMSGRHPAGRPFKFDPTHKPLLHGNHMPRLRGRSTAMERRLLILLFNCKPQNPDRTLKVRLRAEWPGILRWMIEGCLAWQRIGLQPPDAIRAANTSYFEAQNVFGRWIEDCCTLDKIAELPPSILRTSFNRWARANGEEEMGGNAFAEAIDQFDSTPPLTRGRANGKRFVKGIRLNQRPNEGE